MVYKSFDKESRSGISVNEQLAEEPVIKKYKREKVDPRFKGNILAADLAEMGSLSSQNKVVKYLYVSQIFSLNIHGVNLQKIKGKTVLVAFMEIVNESNHKPNYGSIKD